MTLPALQAPLLTKVKYVPKIYDLFENNPDAEIYIIAGGRGKGATWGIGNELIIDAIQEKHFILCTREIKETVDYSSKRTIELLIKRMGLKHLFKFQEEKTICLTTGSEFIYNGLSKVTEDNYQGFEGLTRLWLAEAHKVLKSSWQKLEPTLRENNAKVYIDYNIRYANDPIHAMFTENPNKYPFEGRKDMPELAYLFMDYRDNIFCPDKTLKICARNKKQYSTQDWEWIWLGKLKDAHERYVIDELDVRAAMKRKIEVDKDLPIVSGCDAAHMGGDEIVFYKRKGNKFLDNGRYMTKKRSPVVCDEWEAYLNHRKSSILVIDNGHVGAAIADEMEKRGYYVERINFGGVKEMHYDPAHCKDNATDMAFNFNNMLPDLQLPNDELMCKQVSQRQWDFTDGQKGIRKIESKKEFKKHAVNLEGHDSPDRGDAIWLSCYNKNRVRVPQGMGNIIKAWS